MLIIAIIAFAVGAGYAAWRIYGKLEEIRLAL